jgi:hypothetical protein
MEFSLHPKEAIDGQQQQRRDAGISHGWRYAGRTRDVTP